MVSMSLTMRNSEGEERVYKTNYRFWRVGGFAVDLTVALGIIILVWFVCEWLIHRSSARKARRIGTSSVPLDTLDEARAALQRM